MRWLSRLHTFNLIDVLDLYLIITFVVSTGLRIQGYRAMLGLLVTFPNRWPKLLTLVKEHRTILLTRWTLLAVGVTFALMLGNSLAFHFLWVDANITLADFWGRWLPLMILIASGGLMLYLDFKAVFQVGHFDRRALEDNLDKAEYWLKSWAAPALRVATFGFINPRKIVGAKVQEALERASLTIHGQMWHWSLQIGMRLTFALTIWLTWALAIR